MAADTGFEARLRSDLRDALDAVTGPHPGWATSPAAQAIRAGGPDAETQPRGRGPLLLIAAAIGLVAVAGAVAAGGGSRRTDSPGPTAPAVAVVSTISPSDHVSSATAPAASAMASSATTSPTCATSWSSTGTKDPKGLADGIRTVELDGFEGKLLIAFGHPLDTVQGISIAPTEPPFVDSAGTTHRVAGTSFLRLTMKGLTRATQDTPADMVAGQVVAHFTRTVEPPITEMRRIEVPKERLPTIGPKDHSTEAWIIGLDYPACVDVRTVRETGYGPDEPGDNAIVVSFPPRP